MNPERFDIFARPVEEGLAKAGGGKTLDNFDVAPIVMVMVGDDIDACRVPVKAMLALYVGGMGARDKNFYNEYVTELGYGAAARTIQELYLAGKKDEAAAAVPDQACRRNRPRRQPRSHPPRNRSLDRSRQEKAHQLDDPRHDPSGCHAAHG